MGCGTSKPSRQDDVELSNRPRPAISRPVDPPGQVPRQRRNQQGVPIIAQEHDLTERNIRRALAYVAEYLRQKSKNLVLVAVGGAVNTILLRTRGTTHDVDFFNKQMSASELSVLREAIQYAEERSSVPLGEKWLNNETGTIGGTREQIPALVDQAIKQRDIIYEAPGLTVLAAPWHYAFVTKVGRITYGTGRSYDQDDAVAYLYEYIRRHGNRPVRAEEVRKWAERYRRVAPDEVLRPLNELYQRRYGSHGITFS